MTNTFPFWEAIPIDDAVDDLQEDLGWLINQAESRSKPFVLGETGWPGAGFIEGVGIASPQSQRQYFREAFCRIDVENQWAYYWFTGIDNAWRQEQDPDNTIEGNWGFLYSNLTLKSQFQDFEFACSNGVTYSFGEIDWSIPDYTPAPAALNPASCQAHSGCSGLFGNCCPDNNGVSLNCCGNLSVTSPPMTSPPATAAPVRSPTLVPTPMTSPPATAAPVRSPTLVPQQSSGGSPTTIPTASPTDRTTDRPTRVPTRVPTLSPTTAETTVQNSTSNSPTASPTTEPTPIPTIELVLTPPTPKPTIEIVLTPPTPKPTIEIVFRPSAPENLESGPNASSGSSITTAADSSCFLWVWMVVAVVAGNRFVL
jgi:hypothetical protein